MPPSSSRPHLEQHTARTPDIDFGIIPLPVMTLGHFGGGPKHGTAPRCPRGLVVVGALGISETRQFTGAGRVDENVVGFDVLRSGDDEECVRGW